MKTINETFDDDEYKRLIQVKKDYSWHDFIMLLENYQDDEKEVEEDGKRS